MAAKPRIGSFWVLRKSKTQYRGRYVIAAGDRVFQLVGPKKIISFESWQAAAKKGWVRLGIYR
jgi:hypothetical protein